MEKRKVRAAKLAEREAFEDKRHRLLEVLKQKILVKYGPRGTNKCLRKAQVIDLVDTFLRSHPSLVKVTSLRDVGDLEKTLSEKVDKLSKDIERGETIDSLAISEKTTSTESEEKIGDSEFTEIVGERQADLNPWTLIETFKLVETEESKSVDKMKAEQKKKDMAAALHEQIRLKEETSRLEKAEHGTFLRLQQNAIKKWEEEQILKEQIERERTDLLKQVRQDQIEERASRKKKQLARKRTEELKEMKEIEKALAREEEEKCLKKKKEIEKWNRIKRENAKKLEECRLQKLEEARMDAKLMADMKAKMDLAEEERAKAVEKRAISLEVNGQMLSESGAFKKTEEVLKFEQSLLKAAQDREQALVIEDERKRDASMKKTKEIADSNKQIIEERNRRERIIEKEKEAYAAQCSREMEAVRAEKEELCRKQTETKLNYRQILKDQMEEHKRHQISNDGMTTVERSMNKKLMETIDTPGVKRKVIEKIGCGNM